MKNLFYAGNNSQDLLKGGKRKITLPSVPLT